MNAPVERSLKTRLMAMILATSAIVLIFTAATFVTYEWITVREQLKQYVEAIGQIIAANSIAQVTYDDPENALETLTSLRADPYIVEAALYDRAGRLFTSYATNETRLHIPARAPADRLSYHRHSL